MNIRTSSKSARL